MKTFLLTQHSTLLLFAIFSSFPGLFFWFPRFWYCFVLIAVPNVSFHVYAPSFLNRFIESHAVMLQGNSGLKPKEGEVTSRPWQWPFNYKVSWAEGFEVGWWIWEIKYIGILIFSVNFWRSWAFYCIFTINLKCLSKPFRNILRKSFL